MPDYPRERLRAKIEELSSPEPNTGCWLWLGPLTPAGYGQVWVGGRGTTAQRAAYEAFIGPIPPGLSIDHRCRVRCCVNPAHLEAMSIRENILRGTGTAARHAKQTHCIHGHLLAGENLTIRPDGRRVCRRCVAICNLAFRTKQRAFLNFSHRVESAP